MLHQMGYKNISEVELLKETNKRSMAKSIVNYLNVWAAVKM